MDSVIHGNAVDELLLTLGDYKQLQSGERLYHCPNPQHPDNKKSCSINRELCVYNCHGCDWQGSLYQLAKDLGWEKPHQLIPNGSNSTNSTIVQHGSLPSKPKPKKKPTFTIKELANIQKENVIRLKNNMKEYWDGYLWDADMIDLLDIGVCTRGIWQFAHHNRDGDIIAIRSHKGGIIGDGRAKWYAQHLIYDYDYDNDWILAEGEKDFITSFSRNGQVITGTCGAKSIPKDRDGNYDFSPFKYFTLNSNGYVAYDNDDSGKKYGLIIGQEIKKACPSHNIFQVHWGDDCADKFDITDSYDESPKDGIKYMEAVMNAKKIKLPAIKLNSFDILRGSDADTRPIKHSIQIVDKLVVKDKMAVFGGTAGCNKSMLSMQVGMAIANDEDNVLDFKINEKGLKVLYVDTECGIDEMNRRYNLLKKNFRHWHGSDRFIMISRKVKIISDVLDDVEDMIRVEQPDIVYYDCLYNMSNGRDIAKNHNLSPITDRITDMKMGYNNTPILIAHATKGNHEQGLTMDRIAGGSHLQNWAEHIVLLTRTNLENMRMLRIDKSRSVGFPTCYYGMEWDGDKFFMENTGVIENYREWLVSEQKKLMWSEYLNNIPTDTFNTRDWLNEVQIMGGKSISSAKGYLREMVASGVLTTPHKGSGIYTKNMKVIVADNNEE